jgi:hypothetical protein
VNVCFRPGAAIRCKLGEENHLRPAIAADLINSLVLGLGGRRSGAILTLKPWDFAEKLG